MTIRRTPQDFVVEERPSRRLLDGMVLARTASTPHAVYRVTKTSMTTPDAEQRLAKALGVRPQSVQHAGLKDKHAVTTQHVSVLAPGAGWNAPKSAGDAAWSAELMGWSAEAASASWIERNRFTIVVRDLSRDECVQMDRRAGVLRMEPSEGGEGETLLVVNYFGDQRFGSARHARGFVAARLIRGEFEEALRLAIGTPARKDTGAKRTFTRMLVTDWGMWPTLAKTLPRCPERAAIEALARGEGFLAAFTALPYFTQRLCIEAYQSYLWNKVAAGVAEEMAQRAEIGASDVLRAEDDFGVMVFATPGALGAEEIGRELPMPAPETKIPTWAAEAYQRVLAEENLTLADLCVPLLRRPSFDAFDRPLFAVARGFTITAAEPDELSKGGKRQRRTLRFELPSGSYATVLLRALGQ